MVLVPGMGDDVQAIKAGIMEIADVFVINKADQPGADRLERELHGAECERPRSAHRRDGRAVGIDEVLAALDSRPGTFPVRPRGARSPSTTSASPSQSLDAALAFYEQPSACASRGREPSPPKR